MLNSQNKDKVVITLGVFLLITGISILSNNYFKLKIDKAYSYMNNLLLKTDTIIEEEISQEEVENNQDTTSSFLENDTSSNNNLNQDNTNDYYIGNIEIPKINLNKGFTEISSPYNTVSKNVEVVNGSDYPDKKNGNFILAAHSGTSYLAYFKDLYKLGIGDLAYVNYKNKKYTYEIVNIYEQDKTGKIAIYRDYTKSCLTLITCTKDVSTTQTIYILELKSITNN